MRIGPIPVAVIVVLLASGGLLYWVSQDRGEAASLAPVEVAELGGVPQGHVYTGIIEEPVTFNPFAARSPASVSGVLRYTTDALADWDPTTGALRPALAESWTVGEDGRTIRFELRRDALFASGQPVTRDAVMFTWRVLQCDPLVDTRLGSALSRVDDVRAPADQPHAIDVVLHTAGAANVAGVATGYWVVEPRSVFEAVGAWPEDEGLGEGEFVERLQEHRGTFVGSGPYQLVAGSPGGGWRHGKDCLLIRNVHSWHRKVRPGTWNLAGIRWVFAQNAGLPQLAVQEGRIDFWAAPDPYGLLENDPKLARRYGVVEYVHPLMQPYRIAWNTRRPPMDDGRVRRAMALLAPRQQLVDSLLDGKGTVASGPFPPTHPATLAPLDWDEDGRREGRRLIEDAGYGPDRPLEIELLVPSEDPLFGQMADQLGEAWRKSGVEVTVQTLVNSAMTQRLQDRRFDGAMFLTFDPTPQRDLYPMLHSSQVDHTNLAGYASAEADALLDQLRRGGAAEDLARAVQQLGGLLQDDQPILWLLHRRLLLLFNSEIEGATPGPMGLSPEGLWVAPENQRR